MAELADAADSKSADPLGRGGSIPPFGIHRIKRVAAGWDASDEAPLTEAMSCAPLPAAPAVFLCLCFDAAWPDVPFGRMTARSVSAQV